MSDRSYQKLIVWREADDLCVFTYQITKKFPSEEKFGLVSQMRRSSSSVPTNIVEGNSRRSIKERAYFLNVALASLDELHYQYHLSFRLGYLNEKILTEANDRIQRVGYLLMKFRSPVPA